MELEQATRSTRRDILKKLAVTSAAAGLTATVVSSRAFADSGTVNSRPRNTNLTSASLSLSSSNSDTMVVIPSISFPSGANVVECPFGDNPPNLTYAWTVTRITGDTPAVTGDTFNATLSNATITNTGTGSLSGTFTLTLTIRWACDQRPPRTPTSAWVCQRFSATVSHAPNGNVTGLNTFAPSAADEAFCNASVPSPP